MSPPPHGPALMTIPPVHMASFCGKGEMRERICMGLEQKGSFPSPAPSIVSVSLTPALSLTYILTQIYVVLKINR